MDAAKAGGGPDTIKKVSQASGISNGTVGRIVTGEVATTVDQLAALAQTFGLQAWQLLQPGATSHAHQQVAPSWPLSKVEPVALPRAVARGPRVRAGAVPGHHRGAARRGNTGSGTGWNTRRRGHLNPSR